MLQTLKKFPLNEPHKAFNTQPMKRTLLVTMYNIKSSYYKLVFSNFLPHKIICNQILKICECLMSVHKILQLSGLLFSVGRNKNK